MFGVEFTLKGRTIASQMKNRRCSVGAAGSRPMRMRFWCVATLFVRDQRIGKEPNRLELCEHLNRLSLNSESHNVGSCPESVF